jgi:hypothetical protein
MLRSGEMLPIHRDELNTQNGTVDISARRVKKRRVIEQPLSDLALEIIKEAMGAFTNMPSPAASATRHYRAKRCQAR